MFNRLSRGNRKQQKTADKTMRILVTGSNGMLGREFVEVGTKAGNRMAGWTRADLDLERPEPGLAKLKSLKPDAVIHCAAETNVDRCEREAGYAMRVNGETAGKLAAATGQIGGQFVLISTSGIFDGKKPEPYTELDEPAPATAYARAKVAGEKLVAAACPHVLILRAGWLFGGPLDGKRNFVGARLREAEGKNEIVSATDKRGSPTWTQDFVEGALSLVASKKSGVFHLVNSGVATRQEYVAQILAQAGSSTGVRGVGSDAFLRAAPVPDSEALVSCRLPGLRKWQEALTDYLEKSGRRSWTDRKPCLMGI